MTLQAGGVWVIVYECNIMEVLLNKQSTSNTICMLKSETNKYLGCAGVETWSNLVQLLRDFKCIDQGGLALPLNRFRMQSIQSGWEETRWVPRDCAKSGHLHSFKCFEGTILQAGDCKIEDKNQEEMNRIKEEISFSSSSWKYEGDHTKFLLRGYQQPWTSNNQHKNSQRVPHFGTQLSSCSAAYESVCLAARIAAMHLWRCLPHDGLSMFQTLCTTPSDRSSFFNPLRRRYIYARTDGEIPSTVATGGRGIGWSMFLPVGLVAIACYRWVDQISWESVPRHH